MRLNIQEWKGKISNLKNSYVDEEIKHESVAWIPQARALSILDGEELDINDTEEGAIPSVTYFSVKNIGGR